MTEDNDARNAVRALMERFDLINSQRLGMGYVLAEKGREAYGKLLADADKAIERVIQPLMEAEVEHQQVYAALSDPKADWPAAIMHMLSTSVRYERRGQWKPTPPEGFQET